VAGQRGADIYLIDRFKARVSFQRTCDAIKRLTTQYPETGAIYVEDKANGPAVLDALGHEVPGLIAVTPKGGKHSRATACEPRVEAGNVYLPRPTTPQGVRLPERAWVDDFIEQLAAFPRGEHDDDVDAFSQLLVQWGSPTLSESDLVKILSIGESDEPSEITRLGEPWPSTWPKVL
jgi:predicted phage terminase large subunit-like protein